MHLRLLGFLWVSSRQFHIPQTILQLFLRPLNPYEEFSKPLLNPPSHNPAIPNHYSNRPNSQVKTPKHSHSLYSSHDPTVNNSQLLPPTRAVPTGLSQHGPYGQPTISSHIHITSILNQINRLPRQGCSFKRTYGAEWRGHQHAISDLIKHISKESATSAASGGTKYLALSALRDIAMVIFSAVQRAFVVKFGGLGKFRGYCLGAWRS